MNLNDNNEVMPTDDAFTELFEDVSPRSKPRSHAQDLAFSILLAEWRALSARRKRRNRNLFWGVAASVLFAFGLAFNFLQQGQELESEPVATVARTTGTDIYVNGEIVGVLPGEFPSFSSGDTLVTGAASRVALEWNSGGSLRVNENSQIAFVSTGVIRLDSGAVYFDSFSQSSTDGEAPVFTIETVAGKVSHLGTQFLTSVSGASLTLSVREGTVLVISPEFNYLALPKDKLNITAHGLKSKQQIDPFDATWQWTEGIAPHFEHIGKTARELVIWVGRETGRRVVYRSQAAEKRAASTVMVGLDNLAPTPALRTMPLVTDLRYDIVGEEILIGLKDKPL